MSELTEQEIDAIVAEGGFRNAAGGIYSTSVYKFARAIQKELESRTPEPGQREALQEEVLATGWYHFLPGEDGEEDDYDIYDISSNAKCEKCIPIKIVRIHPSQPEQGGVLEEPAP